MKAPGRLIRLLRIVPDHARTAAWGFLGHHGPRGRNDRVVVQAVIEGPARANPERIDPIRDDVFA